jgi:hypothetical protein
MRASGSWFALLAVVACAGAAEHRGYTAMAPGGPPDGEPVRLLREYTSAMNAGDAKKLIALMSDDVEIIGVNNCRGVPCVGRDAAWKGLVEGVAPGVIFRTNVSWVVEGDRVTARFSSIELEGRPRGTEHLRGLMQFSVRNGHITRVDNAFDLEDPETLGLRIAFGEVVFGLRAPATGEIVARVLLAAHTTPSATNIVIQPVERAIGLRGLVAKLIEGTCAQPGGNAQALHLLEGLDLETRIDISLDRMLSTQFRLELERDGVRVACGDVPRQPSS